MAENIISTRIQLRYDTYENWMSSSNILKPGEVAIARMPYSSTITSSDHTPLSTPPAIGLKVGDGRSYFYELPWVQAVAGDVYTWAKQSTKPIYNAEEIQGLEAYIQEHGSGGGGSSGDPATVTARLYQIVQGTDQNANKYYLQSRTADSTEWTIDTSHYIDLSDFVKIVNWIGEDVDDYYTLAGRIFFTIYTEIGKINFTDSQEEGKAVVAVNQERGQISTVKKQLNLNELAGILSPQHGGIGLSEIEPNTLLVGNNVGGFSLRNLESILDNTTNLATNKAIKTYIDNKTAGLEGAMHYIGESSVEIVPSVNPRVNPQIPGYDFTKVQYGDVITQNQKEFIWTPAGWRILGDEGSYAVKGSIVNADISVDAAIEQSKIDNLTESLFEKVDKVDGKGLSTNDYTTLEKNKLEEIETGAQVNTIEHIFVNDIERPIVTVNGLPKSITLSIDVFDEEHATKLDGIQAGAQVNAIEHILVNGEERPISTIGNLAKAVNIVFNPYTDADQNKLSRIEDGAQVNTVESIIINNNEYFPNENKKVNITLNAESFNLAEIAYTGNIKDLLQTADTYVVLDCGSSTNVI